jgi:hypothetical protein
MWILFHLYRAAPLFFICCRALWRDARQVVGR